MNKELELSVREELQIGDDVEIVRHDVDTYEIGKKTYLIVDIGKATDLAKENMYESLWAFNSVFLESETGIDRDVFRAIAENGQCENNNRVIEKLIEMSSTSLDDFYQSAIDEDGLGHFLSTYDGEEIPLDYQDYIMFRVY